MRISATTVASSLLAAIAAAASALPASAACTRLAFSVNDYGKDGPTKDAKSLLDKYVAKWASDHGIAKYQTGKKDVNCELFLNLIVFDEHTCRAEATVCWDGPPVAKSANTVTAPEKATSGANAPVKRAAAPALSVKPKAIVATATPAAPPIETGTLPAVTKPEAPAVTVTQPPAAGAGPAPGDEPARAPAPKAAAVAPAPEPAAAPEVKPLPALVPAEAKPALAAPKPALAAPKPAGATTIADQALAAAEKAAAAAERAAAAAERAAAAAAAAEKGAAAKP